MLLDGGMMCGVDGESAGEASCSADGFRCKYSVCGDASLGVGIQIGWTCGGGKVPTRVGRSDAAAALGIDS